MTDFVEETASLHACSPNTSLIAFVSAASLYGVEVPWALMYPTRSGDQFRPRERLRIIWPRPRLRLGLDHVPRVVAAP